MESSGRSHQPGDAAGFIGTRPSSWASYRTKGDVKALAKIEAALRGSKGVDAVPFEIEQLASYYSVTLNQAKISFWFSLIFASIGFMVIVGAALLYREGDTLGASIKIVSGLVIDAVAALFFVQSRRAQESMGAFFEKLRTDRQFIEARKICEEIKSDTIKDHLKTILVLHYSGLQSMGMLDVLERAGLPQVLERDTKDKQVIIPVPSQEGKSVTN